MRPENLRTETQLIVSLCTHLVRQHLLPERPTEVQSLQHWVTVAGVPKLEENKQTETQWDTETGLILVLRSGFTYIDQPKVVLINGKLFRSNLLFQGRGIGALKKKRNSKIKLSFTSESCFLLIVFCFPGLSTSCLLQLLHFLHFYPHYLFVYIHNFYKKHLCVRNFSCFISLSKL